MVILAKSVGLAPRHEYVYFSIKFKYTFIIICLFLHSCAKIQLTNLSLNQRVILHFTLHYSVVWIWDSEIKPIQIGFKFIIATSDLTEKLNRFTVWHGLQKKGKNWVLSLQWQIFKRFYFCIWPLSKRYFQKYGLNTH